MRLSFNTLILLFSVSFLFAQKEGQFFFDAICFKSKDDSLSRVDIYVIVPYYSLTFVKIEKGYLSEYIVDIVVYDSTKKARISSKTFSRKIFEQEQMETLGLSGKFQQLYANFILPEGKYHFEVTITDENSKRKLSKSRSTSTLNFAKYNFATSGLMFLSDIERSDGKIKITPYLSDNLADLQNLFLFFEVYNRIPDLNEFDVIVMILDNKGKEITRTRRYRYKIDDGQIYVPLKLTSLPSAGSFTIQLFALRPTGTDSLFSQNDILSVSERSFYFAPSIGTLVFQDLNKAIRQLKYVAYQSDIDYISEATEVEEKRRRFDEFWKRLDPTPATEYNEAFEQYYQRIQYANENFRTFMEGWLTDRGMVYIVLGPPLMVQTQYDYYYSTRKYEIWTYPNNRQFVFVDYSGVGDYRLYSPPTFNEKYQYKD